MTFKTSTRAVHKQRLIRNICLSFVYISGTAVLLLLASLMTPLGEPLPFRQHEFTDVVNEIRSGKLIPREDGNIYLPESTSGITVTGQVYVTHGDSGGTLVFFPSWIGRHKLIKPFEPFDDSYIEGYLFSDNTNDSLEIIAPSFAAPWNARKDLSTQTIGVIKTQHLNGNWFAVEPFS